MVHDTFSEWNKMSPHEATSSTVHCGQSQGCDGKIYSPTIRKWAIWCPQIHSPFAIWRISKSFCNHPRGLKWTGHSGDHTHSLVEHGSTSSWWTGEQMDKRDNNFPWIVLVHLKIPSIVFLDGWTGSRKDVNARSWINYHPSIVAEPTFLEDSLSQRIWIECRVVDG